MTTKPTTLTPAELLRIETLSSLETYTRAMYKAQFGRSFIVAPHHRIIFDTLQDVIDGKLTKVIFNLPPRYTKTEIVIKQLTSYGFALNAACKFLHLSYSDTLVNDNSRHIREIMQTPLYKTLYDTRLEREKGALDYWRTTRGGEFYAVSTQGQVTGFGAGVLTSDDDNTDSFEISPELANLIDSFNVSKHVFSGAILIDDPLKPEDALSDTAREKVNSRFEHTIRSRVNSKDTPIIVTMQRLHEHDLTGYLLELEAEDWTVIKIPAIMINDEGEEYALWPKKHTLEELYKLKSKIGTVFDSQYLQEPISKDDLLYSMGFRTYDPEQLYTIPHKNRIGYVDTADTGADRLCGGGGIDTPDAIYLEDVIYTDKPMEVTEPLTAEMIHRVGLKRVLIESNNGGRGFARAVEKLLRTMFKNNRTYIRWFHQSKNKYVRIFGKSAEVQNLIVMPKDWERRWPEFYKAVTTYRKKNRSRNVHDDAPDFLTGLVEMHEGLFKKQGITHKN